jgi:His-Xaa-Ser system protein HxsD
MKVSEGRDADTMTASSERSGESSREMSIEMSWDKATTPLEAVERALYAMADQVSGTVADSADGWLLTAHARSSHADPDRLRHELRQSVTDFALRLRIAERTDPIRNLVFAVAFTRTGLQTSGEAGPSETAS